MPTKDELDCKLWECEFLASPALRSEFGELSTYISYKRAQRDGRAEIVRRTADAKT